MTVASCPSCKENVTVPVDATADCVVRCPFCHEEFRLEAFLTQLPPALIVLDPGASSSGIDIQNSEPDSGEEASSSNVLGALAVESPDEHDSVPAFDFTPGSATDEDAESEPAERGRRRRQKNPGVEFAKIALGALLAIPAAQIILWLLPGDMKRDPLHIGPAVSRVVPWIVPERFRDQAVEPQAAAPSRPTIQPRQAQPKRARAQVSNGSAAGSRSPRAEASAPQSPSAQTPPATGSSTSPGGQQAADVPSAAGAPETDQPAAKQQSSTPRGEQMQPPPEQSSAAEGTGGATAPDSVPPPPDDPPRKPTRDQTTGGAPVATVRGATVYDSARLRAALEAALQANIAWDTDPDLTAEHRQQMDREFYAAFAQLSEAVTYPPQNDPALNELVSPLSSCFAQFAKEPKKLAMIGNQAGDWLQQESRPHQGIMLYGTVKRVRATGSGLFETELELAALKKRSVTVVSRVDPLGTFRSGDHVLLLGAIVQDPAHNLADYEGQEPMVIMGGFPVVLR